jgi:hypothetical protein
VDLGRRHGKDSCLETWWTVSASIEKVLPEHAAPDLSVDIMMLVVIGGQERTESQFGDLVARTGFTLSRVGDPLPPFNQRIIEAIPA